MSWENTLKDKLDKNMTDEKMAEARATAFADINFNEPDNYGSAKEIGYHSYYAGFLAGLKAGKDMAEADLATVAYMQGAERYKQKWHDLRKNPEDLPPNEHEVYVAVVNETARGKELIYGFDRYLTDDEAWFIESAQEIIAWCEIPRFEDGE